MQVETRRVKNYCSTYKTIILIDKEPFCGDSHRGRGAGVPVRAL